MAELVSPRRGEQFVDSTGTPLARPMRWIEEVSRLSNANTSSITSRLDALEPQYVTIDATDSPYTIADMDYVLADMSAGNVTFTLPTSGRCWVSRLGAANTLTITGTVSGVVNPTILFDGTTAAMASINTVWRWV